MNPFPAAFRETCRSCEKTVQKDEMVFSVPADTLGSGPRKFLIICETCAKEGEYVCKCGMFKRPDYKKCYMCFTEEKRP